MENLALQDVDDVQRPDGSLIVGLKPSEWDAYVKKYPNIPIEELVHIRDTINNPCFHEHLFEGRAFFRDEEKAREKRYGKPATLATSLFMLLSVHVKPMSEKKPFSVYGVITKLPALRIYVTEGGSDFDDGNLILNDSFKLRWPWPDPCHILQTRRMYMHLYDQQDQALYPLVDDDDPIVLNYSPDEFEHVTGKVVHNSEISLILKYVSIPMGVFGFLDLRIFKTKFLEEKDTNLPYIKKVYGKVVATYKNTFGSYDSEEIVLFHKKSNQYATLDLDKGNNLLSSGRCLVAAPVFSLLNIHIHLFDYETRVPILKQDVELGTHDSYESSKEIVAGGFLITASVSWSTPPEQPGDDLEYGVEDIDDDDDNDDDDDQIYRSLEPPPPHSAIEVFSLLFCLKECTELQIHGRLQFAFRWTKDFEERGIDIFKEEKDPLSLFGRSNRITVLNGSRLDENFSSFSLICDLKDTRGSSIIKGHQSCFEGDLLMERQICSIFHGNHGFAALHYSVFSSAVRARLTVFYKQKESEGVKSPSTVCGSFCARYDEFNYSSQYKKDFYRIVLFKGEEVQMDDNGLIPLSRSSFFVPSYSSVMFDVDLMIGTQKFFHKITVPIRKDIVSIQDKECEVKFVLEWSDLK